MKYYTYAYLREDGTPYYIGKGTGYRMYDDRGKACNKPQDKNRILLLKRFGSEFDAFKHEMYMIAIFGRKDLQTGILRNRTDGGDGNSNPIRSDEWRRKQSISQSGKVKSENTKKKISESGRGRKVSDESRKRYSESAKRRWDSEKDNRKEKLINRNKSEENKRKVSESNKNNWNTKSDFEKKKILDKLKNNSQDENIREKLSEKNKEWWEQKNEKVQLRKEKLIERNKSYKEFLFWNDGQNQIRSLECPGTNWKRGRLKKNGN